MGNRAKGTIFRLTTVPRQSTRSRQLGLLALLFISLAFPVPLFSRSPVYPFGDIAVSTSTPEGRLAVFDDVWSAINDRYYDPRFHGIDWVAQGKIFRLLAAEANSAQELYAVLRRMVSSLGDSHTRVYAPAEKFDWWHPRFMSVGIAVREIEGLPTVVKVDGDSAAQRAGVRAGDVIETVNGEAALSLVNRRLADIPSAVTASSRFRAFAMMTDGPPETLVEISWKGKDGKERSARFVRHWEQHVLALRVRRVKDRYAVLEMDAFTKPIASDFVHALKEKMSGVRGIVLDLRGNGGGDAEALADVASAFLGDEVNLGQFTDRSGQRLKISTHLKSLLTPGPITQTKTPLVVLTSERTSSAAEIFVAELRLSRRATIIGTATCGCVLAIRNCHVLPDGGLLDIGEFDYQTSNGDRLEGRGLKPDETVVTERGDLYASRDRAMELALRHLAEPRTAHAMMQREVSARR
jgi:carboxyl-terminal processing protease